MAEWKDMNGFFDRLEGKLNRLDQKLNLGMDDLDRHLNQMGKKLDEAGEWLDTWGDDFEFRMEELDRAMKDFMPDEETAGRVYQNIVKDESAALAPAMPAAGGEALARYFAGFSVVMSQCGRWSDCCA